jgi:nucleoside-diphosphate-sugar epimerase
LADAGCVVSCAHARYAGTILAATPRRARLVFLGSTWRFTRWPGVRSTKVLAGESAFLSAGGPGVMLHPTMIYGAEGEDNVQRLAALLRRLPLVPLPEGGCSLVQPIHQDDVTRAIRAAINHPWDRPTSLVIAGPEPITYAAFVREVAAAAGLKPPRIVPATARLLIALAPVTKVIPGVPHIRADEVRRMLEDKSFDITDMRAVLKINPIPLPEGLARSFSRNSARAPRR